MKQWEAMRLLEENPAKLYEADMYGGHTARMRVDDGYYWFEVFVGKRLIDPSLSGGFNGNVSLNLDWHEVKQLVTWQEAIQAWAGGKTIKTESSDGIRTYKRTTNSLQSVLGGVTKDEIVNGKWYVED